MAERLDVVGLRGPSRAYIDSDILGGRLESIQRVPQTLPCASGDQHFVESEFASLGFTPGLVGSLAV